MAETSALVTETTMVTPGVTHVGAYLCPPDGHFFFGDLKKANLAYYYTY